MLSIQCVWRIPSNNGLLNTFCIVFTQKEIIEISISNPMDINMLYSKMSFHSYTVLFSFSQLMSTETALHPIVANVKTLLTAKLWEVLNCPGLPCYSVVTVKLRPGLSAHKHDAHESACGTSKPSCVIMSTQRTTPTWPHWAHIIMRMALQIQH